MNQPLPPPPSLQAYFGEVQMHLAAPHDPSRNRYPTRFNCSKAYLSRRQVTPIGILIHLPLTRQHAIQLGDVRELN